MKMPAKNKLFYLVLLLISLLGFAKMPLPASIQELDEVDVNKKKNQCPTAVVYLNETDINEASSRDVNGFLINKPGTYILCGNTNWAICTPNSFAITIAASNVTLAGENYSIKQLNPAVAHAIGIQVKEGVSDIQIRNIKFDSLSGGGIWFRGGNSNLLVKDIKTNNCGYYGMTSLDAKNLPQNTPRAFTQGILFDGGYGKPIKDAQVIDCVLVESGILRSIQPPKYESACGAIQAYHASNITIQGCTIDGCIGSDRAYGITLVDISNALVSDVFITDVFSTRNAQGIYVYDVDGEIQDTPQASIVSNVQASQFSYMLDNHANAKDAVADDPTYRIEANHLKAIIPKHKENESALFAEHKWREFRTLYRLVCHDSDKKSKTSMIYAKWVELFCERVLDVKVKVVGGFANLYPSGNTPLPAHRDQYKKWIIGLSFGETRTLDFIPDNPQADTVSFALGSGDVFLFSPDVNNRYQHRILEEPEKTGRRINLTYFLELPPEENGKKLLRPPEPHKQSIPTFEEAEALYNQTSKEPEKKEIV